MEPSLLKNTTQEFEIPLDSRPIIDGVGEMNIEAFSFTNVGIQPLGIYDETGISETTAYLIITYIKKKGCILATIPVFYRYGYLREASFSIFKFKEDSKLTAFKEFLTNLLKTF